MLTLVNKQKQCCSALWCCLLNKQYALAKSKPLTLVNKQTAHNSNRYASISNRAGCGRVRVEMVRTQTAWAVEAMAMAMADGVEGWMRGDGGGVDARRWPVAAWKRWRRRGWLPGSLEAGGDAAMAGGDVVWMHDASGSSV